LPCILFNTVVPDLQGCGTTGARSPGQL